MRKPITPPRRPARSREPETPKMVKGVVDSVNQIGTGVVNQGEGDSKLEADGSGTGAGATFSGSREKGGGSGMAEPTAPPPTRPAITRAGWRDVTEAEGDLGSGFYRFRTADLGEPSVSRYNTIECFGADLAGAHAHLRMLIAHARRVPLRSQAEITTAPVAFRPTRLCKAARRQRGEA